jgi:protein-disulfide isomerase
MSDQNKKNLNKPVIMLLIAIVMIAAAWHFTKTPEQMKAETESAMSTALNQNTPSPTAEPSITPPTTATTDATIATLPEPTVQPVGRMIGSISAPIQIVEFSSLTCGHCAHFHNTVLNDLRRQYIDTGKAAITFREFPLNKPALDATRILNCMPESQYFGFMSMLFQTQDHWAFGNDYLTPLRQGAKLAGMTDEQFDTCLADSDAEMKFAQNMKEEAANLKIESTPTFIINGRERILGAVPVSEFAKVIDPMLEALKNPAATTTTPEETPAP